VKSFHVQTLTCPSCAATLDGATNVLGEQPPGQGDVTVCAYCHAVLAFRDDLSLRPATEIDLARLSDAARDALKRLARWSRAVRSGAEA
jgi:hypothetical protein